MKRIELLFFGLALSICCPVAAEDREYANVKGWEIRQNKLGCVAVHPGRADVQWKMLISPAGNWETYFDDLTGHPANTEFPAILMIDDRNFEETYFSFEGKFIGILPLDQRLALAKGTDVSFLIDNMQLDFSLNGSTAAMLKLEECWHRMTGYDPKVSNKRGAYAFK